MNESTRENLRIAVAAWVSILVVGGAILLIEWALGPRMYWFDFILATLLVFGGLGLRFHRDMNKPKCVVVFLVLLTVHCAIFLHLFHVGITIRTAWYVPIVFAETFFFGLIMGGPGGAHDEEDKEGE
jgi:hypothetical protein